MPNLYDLVSLKLVDKLRQSVEKQISGEKSPAPKINSAGKQIISQVPEKAVNPPRLVFDRGIVIKSRQIPEHSNENIEITVQSIKKLIGAPNVRAARRLLIKLDARPNTVLKALGQIDEMWKLVLSNPYGTTVTEKDKPEFTRYLLEHHVYNHLRS